VAKRNPRNEDLIKSFGVNVRKYRNAKGISMQRLANDCDVEYGAISTIERGLVNCTISTAYQIAKSLDITVDKLFED
jgi:transcriptional regulator with XRE-family HTH domain